VLQSIRQRRDDGAGRLPRVSRDEVIAARRIIEKHIHVAPAVLETLVDIAAATRSSEKVTLGVSTRSLVLAVPALQARALTMHRSYVAPDDIEALAAPLFSHRVDLAPGIEDAAAVVQACAAGPIEALLRKTLRQP
jgi:MoxR-like ATPase